MFSLLHKQIVYRAALLLALATFSAAVDNLPDHPAWLHHGRARTASTGISRTGGGRGVVSDSGHSLADLARNAEHYAFSAAGPAKPISLTRPAVFFWFVVLSFTPYLLRILPSTHSGRAPPSFLNS